MKLNKNASPVVSYNRGNKLGKDNKKKGSIVMVDIFSSLKRGMILLIFFFPLSIIQTKAQSPMD